LELEKAAEHGAQHSVKIKKMWDSPDGYVRRWRGWQWFVCQRLPSDLTNRKLDRAFQSSGRKLSKFWIFD
jgi:hypothetical protein